MFCEKIRTGGKILVALAVLLLGGCAGHKPTNLVEIHKLTVIQSDFATGINAGVDYVTDKEDTIVTLNVENGRMFNLDIWINQAYSTDGLETIYRRRLIQTDKILTRREIRTAKLEKGVIESIKFELFDNKTGKVLFVTKPIYRDDSDWVSKSEEELSKIYPWLLDTTLNKS